MTNKNKELINEFEKLSKPLVDFLKSRCHPHCTIIIDSEHAELLEAKVGMGIM